MAEEREVKIMPVELAIQRELAYRKQVARFLSETEIANLLPLKPTNATNNSSQAASHLESDGWKLVRIEKEEERIPYPTRNSNQISLPALEGPKLGMQAEKRVGIPNSTAKSIQAPRNALDSSKHEMHGKKGKGVQHSSTFRNPDPRSTHITGQSSMSLPPKTITKPYSISNQTTSAVIGSPISAQNQLKSSPFPTQENQRASNPYIPPPNGLGVFCHVCKIDCTSKFNYKQHLKGHKHRAKLQYRQQSYNAAADPPGKKKRNQKPRCEVCEIWCSDENSLRLHFNGKKHKANLVGVQDDRNRKPAEHHWCGLCEILCPNGESYEQHLKGKTHAALLSCVP